MSFFLPDNIAMKYEFVYRTSHFLRGSRSDQLLHFRRGPQGSVPGHECHATGIGADVDGSQIGIGGDYADARERAPQDFGSDLRGHRVRTLSDLGGACVD